jgi:aarF domain-containing kinase
VKFGQGIAASDHVLPPPFFKHMSKLQDKAKACTYSTIAKVFE